VLFQRAPFRNTTREGPGGPAWCLRRVRVAGRGPGGGRSGAVPGPSTSGRLEHPFSHPWIHTATATARCAALHEPVTLAAALSRLELTGHGPAESHHGTLTRGSGRRRESVAGAR
jgi:hypothetical protein